MRAALLIYVLTRGYALPEAHINLSMDRTEALSHARAFLEGQGFGLDGYRSAVIFRTHHTAKDFLEKEYGPTRAGELMTGDLSPWSWSIRFFKPEEEEEYGAGFSPSGRLVFF